MGTLIKKIQCHPIVSTINPPAKGPTTLAIPQAVLLSPKTFARFSTGYRSAMIVRATGIMAPAPNPCNALAMINVNIVLAIPQNADPIINSSVPNRKTGLRPMLSANLP